MDNLCSESHEENGSQVQESEGREVLASALNNTCLILNQNYEPLSITNIRRAICLIYLGKAEVIEAYSFDVRTICSSYVAPSILRLLYFIHIKRQDLPLSRRNVLKRDEYTCQYCGAQYSPDHAPLHVHRRVFGSQGGDYHQRNAVTCCFICHGDHGFLKNKKLLFENDCTEINLLVKYYKG